MRERVLVALRSLPDEYRLPLALRYLAGADYDTIGEQLGLTNGSLRGLEGRLNEVDTAREGTLPDDERSARSIDVLKSLARLVMPGRKEAHDGH